MVNLSDLNLNTISDSELGELLVSAKKAYYTGGKPIMDDATYDTLEEILRQKNPHHRFFKLIGSPNFDTGFPKKTHTMPMGSQNKVTSFSELKKYFELKKISQETDFVVQPKCDGLSLEIEYRQGRVVDAITRGDGFVGDLITQNVVKMQNFVPQLNQPFTGSIRCETSSPTMIFKISITK
jgi:DNA ligase (NAD+)